MKYLPTSCLSALLFMLLWCGVATAADGPPAWALTGEDNTVYVMGSIHVLREDDYPLPEKVEQLWSATDALVLEINLEALDAAQMNRIMARHGRLPDGTTLADVVAADTLARTRELLGEVGLPEAQALQLRPWLLATMLTMRAIEAAGYQSGQGLDMHLYQRAVREGRPLRGLETVADQLGIFHELEPELEARYLRYTLEDLDRVEQEIPRLVRAWREDDQAALEALMVDSLAEFPELFERAMSARNRAWVPRIMALLDETQDYLVVVGSAHLVGPDNVIELLRQRGVEATPR